MNWSVSPSTFHRKTWQHRGLTWLKKLSFTELTFFFSSWSFSQLGNALFEVGDCLCQRVLWSEGMILVSKHIAWWIASNVGRPLNLDIRGFVQHIFDGVLWLTSLLLKLNQLGISAKDGGFWLQWVIWPFQCWINWILWICWQWLTRRGSQHQSYYNSAL